MGKFKETCMPAIFQNQAEKYGTKAAVAYKKGGRYVDLSWAEMNRKIHDLAYYLLSKGVKKGDKIAVFSPNRYEWWVASLATLSIGAVSVPIYATNSPDEAQYIINNSDSRICFVGNDDVSTLIYTSGTTGNPKGVMLTHNNFVSNVKNTTRDVRDIMGVDDIFLSFLPLSHSLEMTCGYFAPICIGSKGGVAGGI